MKSAKEWTETNGSEQMTIMTALTEGKLLDRVEEHSIVSTNAFPTR